MSELTKDQEIQKLLEQYERNNAPKETKEGKSYDPKNYFGLALSETEKTGEKTVRILPTLEGDKTPFKEVHFHRLRLPGDTNDRTVACLKENFGEYCPICEARNELYKAVNNKEKPLSESKKKAALDKAKTMYPRLAYIVRVIERGKENEGVKVWRFNHDRSKEGVFDKLIALIKKYGIFYDENQGRDLTITIAKNQNNASVAQAILPDDKSPLCEDKTKAAEWLADKTDWKEYYSVKSADWLQIAAEGKTPVWSKEENKFIPKEGDKEKPSESAEALDELVQNGGKDISDNLPDTLSPENDPADDLPF